MLSDDSDNGSIATEESRENEEMDFSDDCPHPFSQNELNDFVSDLNLSKSSSELLASRLKERNLLSNDSRITFYRNKHQEFRHFFKKNTFFTVQILFIFCKSLKYHIMNQEIGDYLSTAARNHLSVFRSIMAVSLLQYLLLAKLH